MQMHMGIQRGFQYLVRTLGDLARTDGGPVPAEHLPHPNLSLSLHSLAARVMLMREPGRLYMITAPVDGLRQMLQKALPKDSFAGSTLTQAEALLPERQSEALRVLKEEEARLEEAHKGLRRRTLVC